MVQAGFAHANHLASEMRDKMQASNAELLNILTCIKGHDKAMDEASATTESTITNSTKEKVNITM